MDSTQEWAILVGAALPFFASIILQTHWSNMARAVVAFLLCVVAGLGTTYFSGVLVFTGADAKPIATNCLLVLTAAYALYHGFYKSSGLSTRVETATNLPRIGIIKDTPPPPSA